MHRPFQIAIDGPVAAGKSTVSKLLANRLGFLYVDTGAMYRAVALATVRRNLDPNSQSDLNNLLEQLEIEVRPPTENEKDGRLSTVLLNSEDISWAIREPEISRIVPVVAAMPQVRLKLVAIQQKIAKNHNVVMEGRDITYKVLPDANLKIYLTASDEERIDRQFQLLKSRGEKLSREQVANSLSERDQLDKSRETDPLKIVADAWVFDTSGMSIEQVVTTIVNKVKELQHERHH